MDDNQLQFFQEKLTAQKEAILDEAEKTMSEITDHTSNVPDPNDRATLESGRNFELRIRSRERKLLKKIDEALVRISDRTFGVCEKCGADIGTQRLEARPVTTFCIDCKTAEEHLEKQLGQ